MGKAITEADGLFAIVVVDNAAAGSRSAIIRLMLLARHTSRNLVAAVEIDAKATGPIEVKLQPGITLSGKVAGPQDKPIAKATVRVMLESWGRFTSLTSGRGLTTDAAGRYEVRALPPGQRLLIYASAADFGRTYVEVNLAEAPDGRVEARPIVLKVANLSLAGTVFNNYTGKPVVGALVRVSGQGQPYGPGIKTDADGKFRFDQLCEGKVELSSSAADFHSAGVEIELDAAADRHVAAPPILLTPLPKITGVVRDPEGQPVPGASIVLLAEGEPPVKFKSDAQGTFTTTLDPDYVARRDDVGLMLLARHTSRNLVVAIEIGAKATGPLEVELQPGVTLSGKVAGPQDKPIAEATVGVVAVMRRDSKETGRVWRLPPGRRITTDAAGRYEVKVLPPGQRLWITASAADFGRTDVVAHLAGAADGRVEAPPMVLKVANLSLAGTVVNTDTGKPIVGALVRVSGRGQPSRPGIKTDADGKFRFDKLCAGKVFLRASAADFRSTDYSPRLEVDLSAAGDRLVAAPPILLTPTILKITGVVRDPEGQPVPGASIVLLMDQRWAGGAFGSMTGRQQPVKSDAQGMFTTTLDRRQGGGRGDAVLMLLARHTSRDLAAIVKIDATTTDPLEVKLQPGVTLSGNVTGLQDQPIAKATVRVMAVMLRDSKDGGWGLPPGKGITVTTDAAGRYEVKALPPGQRLSISASAADFGRTTVQVNLAGAVDGRVKAPPIVLKAANLSLAGTVVNKHTGKPVVAASVGIFGHEQRYRADINTGADGTFRFDKLFEGNVQLSASATDFVPTKVQIELDPAGDRHVAVPPILLTPILKITGVVRDPEGQPVPGAAIVLLPGSQPPVEFKSDYQGKFTTTLDPRHVAGLGDAALIFVVRHTRRNLAAAVAIASEATYPIEVKLQPGVMLSGKVAGPQDKPIAKATMRIMLRGSTWLMPLSSGRGITTDAEGRYEVKNLPPGQRLLIFARAAGFGPTQRNINLSEAADHRLEAPAILLIPTILKITGVVRDPEGQPVPGASIVLLTGSQQPVKFKSDAQGTFTTTWHPRRWATRDDMLITLVARHTSRNLVAAVEIDAEATDPIEVKLQPGVTLSGKVTGPRDEPIAKAAVRVMLQGSTWLAPLTPGRGITTDAQGRYEVKALPRGQPLSISARATGFLSTQVQIELDAAGDRHVAAPAILLTPTILKITGVVRDPEGQPVPGASIVLLTGSHQPVESDAQGTFTTTLDPRHLARRDDMGLMLLARHTSRNLVAAVEIDPEARDPIEVRLQPGVTLSGKVAGPRDQPIAEATVRVRWRRLTWSTPTPLPLGRDMTTDAAGRYEVKALLPGQRLVITASATDFRSNQVQIELDAVADGRVAAPAMLLTPTILKITGVIRDPEGLPVEGAVILPAGRQAAPSNAEGAFEVIYPRAWHGGKALILLARHISRNLAVTIEIDADPKGPIEIKLQPGVTLSGKVAGHQDQPIAKAMVWVMLRSSKGWGRLSPPGRGMTTDAEGRYEIKALPRGQRLSISARAAGFRSTDSSTRVEVDLSVAADGRVEAPPMILQAGTLSLGGTVVHKHTGKPFVGALVNISVPGQPSGSGIKTDADGKFRFDKLFQGKVWIFASAADFGSTKVQIELEATGNRHVAAPPMLLTPVPKITGVVRDPEGQPVPGASIVLLTGSRQPVRFKSDAQGRFTTTLDPRHLARRDDMGLMLLARHTSRNLVAVVEIDAETSDPIEVKLQPGVTLSGKVAGPQGKPIAKAAVRVMLGRARGLTPLTSGRGMTTDAEGRYEVKVLPPGQRLSIYAGAAGFGRTHVQVNLAEAADGRVEAPPIVLKAPNLSPAGTAVNHDTGKPVVGKFGRRIDRPKNLKGHTGWVRCVAFSPDGKRLASASDDGTVKVWDVASGRLTLTLKGHTNILQSTELYSVGFSPDGKRLAWAGSNGIVKVWDAGVGRVTLALKAGALYHQRQRLPVYSVAFSPDGKRLASGSYDEPVKVWDLETGRVRLTLKGEQWSHVWSVAFSADGKRLAAVSDNKTVKLWVAETGREMFALEGHGTVRSVAFSADGKWLASAGDGGIVAVMDAETGRVTLILTGHTGTVRSVTFSPDGKWLATGSDDKTVKLWDAETGRETLTLKGHTGRVWSVAFSPDGKWIASGSSDKTVKLWDVPGH